MTRYMSLLASVATLACVSFAHAEPPAHGGHGKHQPPASRAEAISRAKDHLQKLESMSDEAWAQKRQERMERREERHEDRVENRQDRRENRIENRQERRDRRHDAHEAEGHEP